MTKYKSFEELKEELGENYDLYMYEINISLLQRIDKAIELNQYIIDYGFDYDGFNDVENLKGLIDMLVDYAEQVKQILGDKENE